MIHCALCGSDAIHRDQLCESDWWRIYRLARKTFEQRAAAREIAEHELYAHDLFESPTPAVRALIESVGSRPKKKGCREVQPPSAVAPEQ